MSRGGVANGQKDYQRLQTKDSKQAAGGHDTGGKILWRHLRTLDVKGSHFRRQVVIGPYIADFACLAERLIVEVDGSQHGTGEGIRRDDVRTRWLNAEGYRVLRFWNNDVMSKTKTVLETIHEAIVATPPRLPMAGDPPPQGEGGISRGEPE